LTITINTLLPAKMLKSRLIIYTAFILLNLTMKTDQNIQLRS
jgi:hypothetical protein